MSHHTALVIEDDPKMVEAIEDILASLGHGYDYAGNQLDARKLIQANEYSYIILDLIIPTRPSRSVPRAENGENLLDQIRELRDGVPVIILAEKPAYIPGMAIKFVKKGALDYIDKPFPSVGRQLDEAIKEAIARRAPSRTSKKAEIPARSDKPGAFMGGEMVFYPDRVELCEVKILGDTGTGQMRKILEQLKQKRPSGKFVSYSAAKLAELIGASNGQGTITGCMRDFRRNTSRILEEEVGLICGKDDVIESGGQGYRFKEWIAVKDDCGDVAGTSGNVPATGDVPLNERQDWILAQLENGAKLQRSDVETEFGVSDKTAKRDLTELVRRAKVSFERNPKPGYYRLV